MNKNTTIVVTCMERRWPLTRLIKYFESHDLLDSVLISDQSKKIWDKREDFPNVRYVHVPSGAYNFYEMWKHLIEDHISTDYVCWNNDDDFTTPEYIEKGSDFLDKNHEYALVVGETFQFGNHPYGKSEWVREAKLGRIENPVERVLTYFDGLFANPHVIVRKEVVLKAVQDVIESSKMSTSSLAPIKFWDKVFNFYALTMGDKKTLDCLGTVRCNRKPQADRDKGTGSLMTILKEYPSVLEVNTEYTEIIKRIGSSTIIPTFFKNHNPELSDDKIREVLETVFTSRLGAKSQAPEKEMRSLPSRSENGKLALSQIDHFINLYPNS